MRAWRSSAPGEGFAQLSFRRLCLEILVTDFRAGCGVSRISKHGEYQVASMIVTARESTTTKRAGEERGREGESKREQRVSARWETVEEQNNKSNPEQSEHSQPDMKANYTRAYAGMRMPINPL